MDTFIGKDLGRYHILEQLGEGGMASVYKAYDTRLERDVAVKIIRTDLFGSAIIEGILKRFEREAKGLARLTHPNIVGVIDYGEHEGSPYLVMEFLPGSTLKQRLGKPMDWQEAVRLLLPIAQALDYAHQHHIVHRDVKPSNILLTENGQPMLSDFGVAKILDVEGGQTLTGTGMGIGTPEYMAPEQWVGQAGVSSDIYSLGIVFYEMVTGRKPYVADTPAALLIKQTNDPLPRPAQFASDLPEVVENVLFKALAKNPEDRYPDMTAFIRALEGLLMNEGRTTPAVSTAAAVSQVPGMEPAATALPFQEVTLPQALSGKQGAAGNGTPPPTPGSGTGQPAGRPPGKSWLGWVLGAGGMIVIAVLLLVFGGKLRQALFPMAGSPQASTSTKVPFTPMPTLSPVPKTADCSSPDVFCVGLVTDVGKVDDKSFNQTAWEGVQNAQMDGWADRVQYIETTDTKDYEKNIATFIDAGYDEIVTVGFNLTEATYNMALSNPQIKFIGIDQMLTSDGHPGWPLANLVSISYNEDQSGFLVGALGAMMSATHKIGAVCGTDAVPPVWRYGEGYKAGAAYEDARNGTTTEVTVVYHSDVGFDLTFTDPVWGADTANAMIDKGVDVVFGCGGNTGNGAVIAAAQRSVYAIGVDTDQYYTLPEADAWLLSSALKPETQAVTELIRLTKQGQFPTGGIFWGPSGYAPYHDLASNVPASVDTEMKALLSGILDGSIKTDVPPAKPAQ